MGGQYDLTLSTEDLLIDGSQIGNDRGDCYLAIFRSQLYHGNNQTWVFGNIFMEKYYMVYDMTPNDLYG